jgi:hypothetical protein
MAAKEIVVNARCECGVRPCAVRDRSSEPTERCFGSSNALSILCSRLAYGAGERKVEAVFLSDPALLLVALYLSLDPK